MGPLRRRDFTEKSPAVFFPVRVAFSNGVTELGDDGNGDGGEEEAPDQQRSGEEAK